MPYDEYILAYVIGSLPEEKNFIAWPLHITLMPWFILDNQKSETEAAILLAELFAKYEPMQLKTSSQALFGPRNTVPVQEINTSPELQRLHNDVLKLLQDKQWDIAAKHYTGATFRPHITLKKGKQVPHTLTLDKIHLVKAPIADPRTRVKKVMRVLPLGGFHAKATA
ncbi:MAG TPA: 2'-5' RNA ligase family protein [Candidatus Saccharimonadales bacterium]|nr:2'-5' RNA ligase family protein [Candidatus Saccharimonadales bacterium]